ncbi:MAG: hypothetical protein IID58_09885 [Proteobacteria bacterium]|nr:hypothetical protein [Pseudomonadota bacterium]
MQASLGLITPPFIAYLIGYSLACVTAVFLMFRVRQELVLFQPAYWRFLRSPWKLVTFAIAALAMTIMAPYTGDPTWDYVDASFMSIATFLTAPWAVATLFLAGRRQVPGIHIYIAVCVWMFSVSWAYDVYILLKHGYYPPTWLPNIVLSSILYFAAGLFWNLQRKDGRGVVFGFMEPGWPDAANELGFRRVAWFAVPIMILVTVLIAPFLI